MRGCWNVVSIDPTVAARMSSDIRVPVPGLPQDVTGSPSPKPETRNPKSTPGIGLFGGSFDPVHCGHLLVAQAAFEELALDRLFFVPASQSPFKPENVPAPAVDRARLLRLALAGWTH